MGISRRGAYIALSTFSFLSIPLSAKADINVMASIKPVHSIVSMVMGKTGKPGLIVDGAASPHTYSLKPSQAQEIAKADVIFWIGHTLEPFLEKPLDTIGANALQIELMDTAGIEKFEFREGGAFEGHGDHDGHDDHDDHDDHDEDHDDHDEDHDDHDEDHDDHDDHDEDHDDHDDHDEDHDDHAKHDEDEDDHDDHDDHDEDHDDHDDHDDHSGHGHAEGESDPHIWLDPQNAKTVLAHVAHVLGDVDPANKETYEANADAAIQRVDKLISSIEMDLGSHKDGGFILFHDGYQYFERRFGLQAAGAISINPDVAPGAKRMSEIRKVLSNPDVKCVFTEPQFEPKIVTAILDGTDKKSVEIDPLGANIKAGPDLYFTLLQKMSASFKTCLN